jgi:LmbE family N-acetylglucosaminyl deacetylase
MATLVTFHAHPDDESIATGGTMAKAAGEGHRVVLVVATKGEHGEVAEGFLRPGEQLWERRVVETHEAARILGVARVEFLGYVDSGMMGTPENELPGSFWTADVGEAAQRLAAILTEERADVLTIYDENGVYGHPDHIQVHRVGARASDIVGTPRVYESTVDMNQVAQLLAEAAAEALAKGGELPGDIQGEMRLGVPGDRITTVVDVTDLMSTKRAAMAAHASQISETSFFLAMPPGQFQAAFGHEAYILRGAPPSRRGTDLFEGLPPSAG